MTRPVRRLAWAGALLVAVVALVVAATGSRGVVTNEDRVNALASSLACPVCQGQSIGESDVPVAREIRAEIRRRVDAGETDEQIRGFLVEIYGEDIDYAPSTDGVTGLVWILPPIAAVAAIAGLVVVFRRWRVAADRPVADADVALVEQARRDQAARDRSG